MMAYAEDGDNRATDDQSPVSKHSLRLASSVRTNSLPGYEEPPGEPGNARSMIPRSADSDQRQTRSESQPDTFQPKTMQPYEQFRKVLGVYHNLTKNPNLQALNLRGDALWEDVMNLARDAQEKYLQKGEKGWRKVGRGLTDNAEIALPYLKFFNPNLEYPFERKLDQLTDFEAAAQIGEKRMKVLEALIQIPDAIVQADHGIELFPDDHIVREKAEHLYLMALAAIEGTIGWLEQGSIKKQIQALGLGPIYTRDFKRKIKDLEDACKTINRRVTFLCSGSLVRTERKVDLIETSVQTLSKTGGAINEMSTQTFRAVNSMRTDLERTNDQTKRHLGMVSEEMKILTQSAQVTNNKIEDFANFTQVKDEVNRIWEKFMTATVQNAEWRQKTHEGLEIWKSEQTKDLQAYQQENSKEIQELKRRNQDLRRLKRQVKEMHQAVIKLDPKELVQILDVSADVPRQDLQRILRASTVVTDSFAAMSFLDSEAFKAWYCPDRSTQWFLEGGVDARTSLRHTPLSLMCSKLVEGMQNMEPAVPIYFFCGSHTSQQDPCRGPTGMIKSLIGQVLQLYPVQLNFIPSQRYRVQLESGNIETLCHCFIELVKQLPMDTILLCIIDGISYFETREFSVESKYVVGEIQALVDIDDLDPRVKLLVTCPLRSKGMVAQFPPECCTRFGEVSEDSRAHLTEREVLLANRRPLRRSENELVRPLKQMALAGTWSEDSSGCESESNEDNEAETAWE